MTKVKNMPKITVLVEGENELNYWRAMPFLGTPKKFNLWHAKPAKLKSLLLKIKRDEQIIIIADTDELVNLDNFNRNVIEIKKHCQLLPMVILQCKNFEDELCYSCGCKIKALYDLFGVTGLDNLKTQINQEQYLRKKLSKINHQITLMWERSKDDVERFKMIQGFIINHQDLIDNQISDCCVCSA